jgi:hypothetical protein
VLFVFHDNSSLKTMDVCKRNVFVNLKLDLKRKCLHRDCNRIRTTVWYYW